MNFFLLNVHENLKIIINFFHIIFLITLLDFLTPNFKEITIYLVLEIIY
jgi:hypothetical protein